MAIAVDPAKGQELKDFLDKHWPDTLEIVRALALGEEYDIHLFADCWPSVTTLILTYNEGSAKKVFIFSTDAAKSVSMLEKSGIITDLKISAILGADGILEKIMSEVVSDPLYVGQTYNKSPEVARFIYNPSSKTAIKKPLPSGYKLDAIHSSDIEHIASKWHPYGGLKKLMIHYITNYPNIAVYDTRMKPPQPISWVTGSGGLGALWHLHTVEEHRGKGLATLVIQEITEQLLAKGITPLVYIELDNKPSQSLFIKCGYVRAGSVVAFMDALQ